MKKVLAYVVIILGVIYLINPTAGWVELIPDTIPGIGNLDEVGITVLVIKAIEFLWRERKQDQSPETSGIERKKQ